jgi:citrate lyase subunit beta/citryl-CoA lyase
VTIQPRRSALYMPASNVRAIEKAQALPCDVVILDLEDAVAPELKSDARLNAVRAVEHGGFGSRELVVRINALDTPWGKEDIKALAAVRPAAILVPKINSHEDVLACRRELGSSNPVNLWAMVETPMALLRLTEIVATSKTAGLTCLVMGTNDLALSLQLQPDTQRSQFIGVFMQCVIAARAYGLSILDGVFNSLDDAGGLEAQCRQARAMGFDGKTLIHPRQVDICNAAFTPDADAVAWAQRIVDAFAQPENNDKGALRLDGKMVERLHLIEAQRTLVLADTPMLKQST